MLDQAESSNISIGCLLGHENINPDNDPTFEMTAERLANVIKATKPYTLNPNKGRLRLASRHKMKFERGSKKGL